MPLPPWSARNQREKNAMRDWMCDQLDRVQNAKANRNAPDATEFEWTVKQDALEQAKTGDVRELRRLYPEIADYIHPNPKDLKRGRRPRRPNFHDPVLMAKNAVPLIREIWRKRYDNKWRRRPEDGYDAYEIAAHYYGVDADDVKKKPSGRRKKIRAK
jgi:hypothetical protein